ncbi:MAG: zincin-like metallopeptidase domain-containing protein [Hyphomonadaceae bacterium]|nr:zincin-like metallopeptidase domain-containing protein [Hyphomonadaceae bacterium]
MPTNERASIYARITDQIVAAIERGVETKRMPWHHDGSAIYRPTNVASKKAYRGINTLALWASADAKGYPSGLWGTFKQWFELGAMVRKGERASAVVLWKQVQAPDAEDDKKRFFARGYSVFNVAQVDGHEPEAIDLIAETERLAHAEAFIAALGVNTIRGGDMAFYRPSTDTVHLPPFERFFDTASAYGVELHECGHASGAAHRLNRDLSGRFGSAPYAAEEVIVELASGFVLADLGIAHNPRDDHASYIASWLALLKEDPRAIFTAASKAQEIADWMHAQQSVEIGPVTTARPDDHPHL